jgi:NADH-quinone oxidoreductase subunit J
MNIDLLVFLIVALVAVGAGLGMLFSRSAIYSALYLVVNFVAVAIFYLMLGAPFIALSQVAIYAGAIMVLFLFVIMLLGTETVETENVMVWQRPLAMGLGALLFLGLAVFLFAGQMAAGLPLPDETVGTQAALLDMSRMLFSSYLLPFEVTSILLLVAMVGAIVLTKKEKGARE